MCDCNSELVDVNAARFEKFPKLLRKNVVIGKF